ncbi:hypothetical protein CRUP_003440 [Coryphaenoides rupestris]|nr:hypothetical protein CRUP_003440 [Coryphaenoides rupestris]
MVRLIFRAGYVGCMAVHMYFPPSAALTLYSGVSEDGLEQSTTTSSPCWTFRLLGSIMDPMNRPNLSCQRSLGSHKSDWPRVLTLHRCSALLVPTPVMTYSCVVPVPCCEDSCVHDARLNLAHVNIRICAHALQVDPVPLQNRLGGPLNIKASWRKKKEVWDM